MHPISCGNQPTIKKPKEVEFADEKTEKAERITEGSKKKKRNKSKEMNKDLAEEPKEFDLYGGFAVND
jgi:hypothetical protein